MHSYRDAGLLKKHSLSQTRPHFRSTKRPLTRIPPPRSAKSTKKQEKERKPKKDTVPEPATSHPHNIDTERRVTTLNHTICKARDRLRWGETQRLQENEQRDLPVQSAASHGRTATSGRVGRGPLPRRDARLSC